jgi:hypothetical protein
MDIFIARDSSAICDHLQTCATLRLSSNLLNWISKPVGYPKNELHFRLKSSSLWANQRYAESMPMLCGVSNHKLKIVLSVRLIKHVGICANTKIRYIKKL